jgi:UDP-N-acetylmuramyl tripeptide synthase
MIFTSDNPRHEDPEFILHEMMDGIPADLGTVVPSDPESGKKVVIRHDDRAEAIRMAVQMTASEDILLVAGKGHETYQEIKGVRYPFSDADQLHMEFELLANSIQNSKSKV